MLIRPIQDIRKTINAARNHGIYRTARLIAEAMEYRVGRHFDQMHGIETFEYVMLSSLGYGPEEQHRNSDYRATPVRTLRVLLSRLPHNLRSFTFIDFGSGKGRALLVAADFAFRRIIGVEFSAELHRIAEANLRGYRGRKQRCFDVSSVHARAEEFSWPDGDLVLYFYNPFGREIMERVLGAAVRTWQESPRTIYLVFIRMRFRPLVKRLGIFREVRVRRLPFDLARPLGYDGAVFVAEPESSPCLRALRAELAFPSLVFGPVERRAL
jgi:SAM-dependent methyltransferase